MSKSHEFQHLNSITPNITTQCKTIRI